MTDSAANQLQNTRFLLLYALAVAGGAVAYVPFLTILLPLRVTELAGQGDVEWLAGVTFVGAVSASLASIVFGWLSDLTRNRTVWIWLGLIASSIMLVIFPAVESFAALIAFIVLWQVALNMMLSPMTAWAGDYVPDRQKGRLGGLLSLAPALGAFVGALVTLPGLAVAEERLWWVAAIVAVCVLPALLWARPAHFSQLVTAGDVPMEAREADPSNRKSTRVVLRMWWARLLVQICEAALFAYVLFWFRSIDMSLGDDDTAQILSATVVVAVPAALWLGWWADRTNRPISPLMICALISGIGLAAMALSHSAIPAVASYAVFAVAASVFLSLHTGQTLRVLNRPENRGRDMGIFNLTNTVPSLIMPGLVVLLVPVFGFPALLAVLSILALLAALLLRNLDSAT